jgi:hypothetical protein
MMQELYKAIIPDLLPPTITATIIPAATPTLITPTLSLHLLLNRTV